jgi:hypothetical protein
MNKRSSLNVKYSSASSSELWKDRDKDDGKKAGRKNEIGGGQAGSDILYTKHVGCTGAADKMDFAVISAHAALIKREYSAVMQPIIFLARSLNAPRPFSSEKKPL